MGIVRDVFTDPLSQLVWRPGGVIHVDNMESVLWTGKEIVVKLEPAAEEKDPYRKEIDEMLEDDRWPVK